MAEKLKEREAEAKLLMSKIDALNRIIKEDEKKDKEPPKNKLIIRSEDIVEDFHDSLGDLDESHMPSISKGDVSLKKMLQEMETGEREWKGKFRKA